MRQCANVTFIYNMEHSEKKNVYLAYNKIAAWYAENRSVTLKEQTYLDQMLKHLAVNSSILDIGCGTGRPILEYLNTRSMEVTGVDASSEMLQIAKTNFPSVAFILQDMRLLELNRKFDGIIAWNSLFHLPATDQRAMFGIFKKHINIGGVLLFTSGTEQGEAWGLNGGENLYHASLDIKEYERLLLTNGFTILKNAVNDPDCGGATVWMTRYDRK